MSLFRQKEICAVCGIPIKGRHAQLTDGVLCKDCLEKCASGLSRITHRSSAELVEFIKFSAQNKAEVEKFQETDRFGALYADFNSKYWFFSDHTLKKPENPIILSFDQLADYSVTEDGNTIQKSGAGSAIAGGLLFGGLGLVAGGLMGRKVKETINKMSITIYVNSPWVESYTIPIITAPVKKGTITYNSARSTFEAYTKLLDSIQAQSVSTQPLQTELSPADELKKYKELLDMGAITQSEFDMKKVQLLNL